MVPNLRRSELTVLVELPEGCLGYRVVNQHEVSLASFTLSVEDRVLVHYVFTLPGPFALNLVDLHCLPERASDIVLIREARFRSLPREAQRALLAFAERVNSTLFLT